MARLLTALPLFFLVSIPAWAEDFRDAKIGMSPQEVPATEDDAEWEPSGDDYLASITLSEVNLAIASSPELAKALVSIAGIYEDAPPEERLRALAVWRAVFDGWSNVHRQHPNGTIDSALYDALLQEISAYAGKYYGSDAPNAIERRKRQMMWAWESERSNYERDFQSFVDDNFGVKP